MQDTSIGALAAHASNVTLAARATIRVPDGPIGLANGRETTGEEGHAQHATRRDSLRAADRQSVGLAAPAERSADGGLVQVAPRFACERLAGHGRPARCAGRHSARRDPTPTR